MYRARVVTLEELPPTHQVRCLASGGQALQSYNQGTAESRPSPSPSPSPGPTPTPTPTPTPNPGGDQRSRALGASSEAPGIG